MDSTDQQGPTRQESPETSYWTSVGVAAFIFGVLTFVISLISAYSMINAEPTGSIFSPAQQMGTLACLVGAFGGMLATWHYAREYDVHITLGRGALIGFLTGVGISLIGALLNQLWQFVDPNMVQRMIDSAVANLEAMGNLPEEQRQQIIDTTVEGMRSQQGIGAQLLWGIPMYGILNLLTGMIGARIFGKEE